MGNVSLGFVLVLVNLVHVNPSSIAGIGSQRLVKRQTYGCLNSDEFKCNSGQCISRYEVCDGEKNCRDGSDETTAACRAVDITTCTPSAFQCKYGACISTVLRCDGNIDCSTDGSDEEGCGGTLPQTFPVSGVSVPGATSGPASVCNSVGDDQMYSQCDNGQCVDKYSVCDGVVDCQDKSDETETACFRIFQGTCPEPSMWRCKYGACLSQSVRCNGPNDCLDGSDEENCKNTMGQVNLNPTTFHTSSAANPPRPTFTQSVQPVVSPDTGTVSVGDDQMYSKCDNGQYVDKYSVCDGVVDCQDKSDETETACFRIFQGTCPDPSMWRCKYGACLSQSVRCDGPNDCLDGSDEENCKNTFTHSVQPVVSPDTGTVGKTCKVPEYPQNRQFTQLYCKGVCGLSPSQVVSERTVMVITCDPGHHINSINPQTISSCTNGQWFPEIIPQCVKLCPTLTSSTLDMICWSGPDNIDCSKPMLPKTKINFECKDGYTSNTDNMPKVIRCEESGQWSASLPECVPKCGVSNLDAYHEPTVLDGSPTKLGNFPWHTALFQRKNGMWEAACGGTLITSRVVLTAAHCVTGKSQVEPPIMSWRDVRIGVGKYHREWSIHDGDESIVEVREIHVNPNYKGQPKNYEYDIATLVLASDVFVTSNVMPACVDYGGKYVDQLFNGKEGFIAGWGNRVECGGIDGGFCTDPSPHLLYTKTRIMNYTQCYRATQSQHPDLPSVLTADKYCAGDGKKSIVQQGDSGGGLTFVFDGKHYVYGIVSTKLKVNTENEFYYAYASFTSVPYHMEWLQNQV